MGLHNTVWQTGDIVERAAGYPNMVPAGWRGVVEKVNGWYVYVLWDEAKDGQAADFKRAQSYGSPDLFLRKVEPAPEPESLDIWTDDLELAE